jgi:hypothetical protein
VQVFVPETLGTPQYYVRKDIPFLMPGFTIMMFRAGTLPLPEEDRMMVRLPENEWATIYLPKADLFRDRFRHCVRMALDDEKKRLNSPPETLPRKKQRAAQFKELEQAKELLAKIRRIIDE